MKTAKQVFVSDSARFNQFTKRMMLRTLMNMSFINIPLLVMAAFSENALPIAGLVLFTSLLALGATFPSTQRYISIRIKLTSTSIQRDGDDFQQTQIRYDEIGEVIEKSYGLIILKKGFAARFDYYIYERALRLSDSLIFIPSMLEDYENVKEHIFSKAF